MSPFRSLALLLLVAGCGLNAPTSARYTGPAPACGRSEGGGTTTTLTRLGGGFALAPYDGSLIVNGTVAPDGAASGSLVLRPAQASTTTSAGTPAAKTAKTPGHPQIIAVTGHITPDTATLAYAAPGCTAALTLARVHPPLL